MEATTSTTVTAEIPAVPANPNYGVLLPDGSIWYPGSQKRLPAPLLLRVTVWALAFLVLIAAVGAFIIHAHPSWVDPVRRVVATAPPASGAGSGTNHGSTGATTGAVTGPTAAIANPQPLGLPASTTVYDVKGTTNFTVLVKTGPNDCYVLAYNLVNGQTAGAPIFNGTLPGNASQPIVATGPIQVEVAAIGSNISIWAGFKQIGTVTAAASVPWYFRFLPSASHS